jgi:hypothetical protein
MNAQEKVHATIPGGLALGRTVAEIVPLNNLSKSTMKCIKIIMMLLPLA